MTSQLNPYLNKVLVMQKNVRIFILALSITGVSCVGQKKMNAAKQRLEKIREEQLAESRQLQNIAGTTDLKRKENRVDSIIKSRFDFSVRRINIKMDSAALEIIWLDSLMADKREFRRAYKKTIMPRLARLDSFRNESRQRQLEFGMIEEGINMANYTLFDLAAFFGPGKYNIPVAQQAMARQSFEPLIDSVLNFSGRFKSIRRKATLVILGYADASGFEPGSPLYIELARQIGRSPVTKTELNRKLSELRAEALIRQLQQQFLQKMGVKERENLQVEFIGSGKGEQLPFQRIKDYKDEDDRRRIVLCYWAVLPG
jgi:outer membrane protein OmpA-like peptidoglycan-associated protein